MYANDDNGNRTTGSLTYDAFNRTSGPGGNALTYPAWAEAYWPGPRRASPLARSPATQRHRDPGRRKSFAE